MPTMTNVAAAVVAVAAGLSGGSVAAPLQFATANNQHPLTSNSYIVTNNGIQAPQVDIIQIEPHVVGVDFTVLTPAIVNQIILSNNGIKNNGNTISISEMYVNYNGVTVGMTSAGATTATVADASLLLFDPMPSTMFAGAVKFTKGTTLQFRMHYVLTSPSTQKLPTTNTRLLGQTNFYYDARKVNITTGVSGTGALAYTMKSATGGSAVAAGTSVTLTLPSTANLVTNQVYAISGATGTGTDLNYNGNFVITVQNSTTITYTAASAPTATSTGSLTVTALNGTDINFSVMVPTFALGNHTAVTPLLIGDSKTFGTSDSATAIAVQGMTRCLFANAASAATVVWPGCNFGHPNGVTNDALVATNSGSLTVFESLYAYGTHAIVGYGTNGFQSANNNTLYARLRAKGIRKIVQRSLTPRTSSSSDSYTTTTGQTLNASWGVGSAADTYEQALIALLATNPDVAYYQSVGERANPTVGTADYWKWAVNGTNNYSTSDGTHEGGTAPGYELMLSTAGSIQTAAGGTVSTSLRAYVAAFT